MKKNIRFVFISFFAVLLVSSSRASGAATPTPTIRQTVVPSIAPVSTVFKKKSPKRRVATAFGLDSLPENEGFLKDTGYYNRLNASLYSSLSEGKPKPTADEKFWGAIGEAVSYSCAGVAAAQSLGILPDGKTKKK